ncbi:MAG: glycosyltransferase [Desulfuromonadaceae bacterium]|nr:glycosyltransferase [Desulfuromonadaceae bacterium]
MRILICSPEYNPATGNWITATRYQRGLQSCGHEVHLCHLDSAATSLERATAEYKPDILLLIHAFRTGRQWLNSPLSCTSQPHLPVIVLLSGTDINEGLYDPMQAPIIERVLTQADALLIQNPLEAESLRCNYPQWAAHLYEIPPGIEMGMVPYTLRQSHLLNPEALLFLCPASIRPVKGVLELLELFDYVAEELPAWEVLFCGPELDSKYSDNFLAAIDTRVWAHYLGVLPPSSMGSVLQQVDVVVNNSVSEGISNALIEAAVIGCPILAHDIPGNRPVVEHGVNGLLYQDKETFVAAVKRLLCEPELRRNLKRPNPERYCAQREAQALHELCCSLLQA